MMGRSFRMPMYRFMAILVLAVILTGLVVLTGYAKTELTFWSWRPEDAEAYAKFIKAFEAKNPDISIKFIPYKNTEYNTILATALQGGSGPDLLQLRSYGGMEQLANAGYLLPLDTKSVPALSKFAKDILIGATNRNNGKIYGVPFAIQTVQVLYNKAVFEKYGLKEPATWDEFVKLCETLKGKGLIPLANGAKDGWTLETLFGGVAPNFYGDNKFFEEITAGKTTFNDPRFVGALRRMLELRPYMAPNFAGVSYTDMQALFSQEVAAMLVGGSYELGVMATLNPGMKIGAFAVPGLKRTQGGFVAAYMDGSYAINNASPKKKEALKFLNFVASKEYGQMFTDSLKQMSAVPGCVPTDPVLAELSAMAAKKSTPHLMVVAFRFEQPSGSTLLQNDLQAMFADKLTPGQVAADIQDGLAKWYKPFQK